ncbi:MAG: TlpA family protein disulfide reductase [Acidobacteriota bacterium]
MGFAERLLPEFTAQEIQVATEVDLSTLPEWTEAGIQRDVYLELVKRGVDVATILGQSHCSALSACSVEKNLNSATGEELARYEKEKAEDGTTYADWQAPDLAFPATDGSTVSLMDLRGRPVLLTLLADHCSHSLNTLPILDRIRSAYQNTDFAVVPVYVNSGSVDDVRSWTDLMDLDLPLAVADARAAELFQSDLVPSTFLIDRQGHVTERLVGFKNGSDLDEAVHQLMGR